ncbi:MAG: HEAT repeat domain-containing protein, partial [Pirellulales bacterium]
TGFAMREIYDEALVDALVAQTAAKNVDADARARAVMLLAQRAWQPAPWRGEWWAYHPALKLPPAKTTAWKGTEPIRQVLRRCLADDSPEVRRAAVGGLRQLPDADSAAMLRGLFEREADDAVRVEILEALGATRDQQAAPLVERVLSNPRASASLRITAIAAGERIGGAEIGGAIVQALRTSDDPQFRVAAAAALGKIKAAASAEALAPLARDARAEVRQTALESLARIGDDGAMRAIVAASGDDDQQIRRDAISALGGFSQPAARAALLAAYRSEDLRAVAIAALTQRPDVAAIEAYVDGLASTDAELRETCRKAIREIRDAALPALEKQAAKLSPEVIARLQDVYRDHALARRGPLFATAAAPFDPQKYVQHVREHLGDARRGRERFFDAAGMGCAKCHRVGNEGGEVGPDLSSVGEQFDRVQLAEHVLFPNRAIREGYQEVLIRTTEGRQYSGILRTETEQLVVLRDAASKDHPIAKEEIEERRLSGQSAMPERLVEGVPVDGFADLVAYLTTLRRRGGTPPPRN